MAKCTNNRSSVNSFGIKSFYYAMHPVIHRCDTLHTEHKCIFIPVKKYRVTITCMNCRYTILNGRPHVFSAFIRKKDIRRDDLLLGIECNSRHIEIDAIQALETCRFYWFRKIRVALLNRLLQIFITISRTSHKVIDTGSNSNANFREIRIMQRSIVI